jgi:hypothetical protein
MKNIPRLAHQLMRLLPLFTVLLYFSALPPSAVAQTGTAGQNAISPTNSGCSPTAGSSAFIDAIAFIAPNRDFCAVLNTILAPTSYPAAGAVVDARGLPGSTGTSMVCASSPWGSGSGYVKKPSTILLPAGTITIPTSWILPNGTKLIGADSQPITTGGGTTSLTAIQLRYAPAKPLAPRKLS